MQYFLRVRKRKGKESKGGKGIQDDSKELKREGDTCSLDKFWQTSQYIFPLQVPSDLIYSWLSRIAITGSSCKLERDDIVDLNHIFEALFNQLCLKDCPICPEKLN
jgi:hypothetical protein